MEAEEAQTKAGTVSEREKEIGSELVCLWPIWESKTRYAVRGCAGRMDEKSSTTAVIYYYYCGAPSPAAPPPEKAT